MTHEKDNEKRNKINRLLKESNLKEDTKKRIEAIIEKINNGDLEDMFNQLKQIIDTANIDN